MVELGTHTSAKVVIFVGCYGGQSADSLACIASWKTNDRTLRERERGQHHWPKEMVKRWLDAYAPKLFQSGRLHEGKEHTITGDDNVLGEEGTVAVLYSRQGHVWVCWHTNLMLVRAENECVLKSRSRLTLPRPAPPSNTRTLPLGRVGAQASTCVLRCV